MIQLKLQAARLPVNTLEQSWHSYAMSSTTFSIFAPYLILGFFTNWILIGSWSLAAGKTEQDFQVSLRRAALSSACSHSHRGAVWVCWVRGFLFFWRMVPFPQPSPGWAQGCAGHHLTGTSDPYGGWPLEPGSCAEVKCPCEQRGKCSASSSSGKV